jgi:hypothetical protein
MATVSAGSTGHIVGVGSDISSESLLHAHWVVIIVRAMMAHIIVFFIMVQN